MSKSAVERKPVGIPVYMILFVLIVAFSLSSVVAVQDENSDEDKTLSPYFFVQTDDDNDQLPLKTTAADVTVSGVIADVEVTQVYKNEGKNTLEAIYIFPGSTRAAVYAMRMTVGERTIQAKVEEKKTARKRYEKALSEGKTASLLEQQRPNVFQMNVGNILPGDEITVKLNYTELLVPENCVYEFVYPTVVGPRYSNKTAADASANEKWVANPYLAEGKEAPFTFAFSCRINSGIPIKKITSPSHEIGIEYSGKTSAVISLDTSTASGNRDVVVRYLLAGDQVESGLLMNIGKEEDFFLLMVEPPQRVSRQQIAPREYIFIMDVSGSMNGFPMEVAKSLMEQLFAGLRSNDYFNVLLFAGSNKLFSDQSVPYNSANLKRALAMMKRERGAGGTELMPALRKGLELPQVGEDIARSIVVITDGFVSVEKEAFDYIRENLDKGNVFAFGIGSSVNRYLIEGMARAGMGEPFVALNKSDAVTKAEKFKSYIEAPVLTDISVSFDGMNVSDLEPPTIPDLFAKRPIVLFGKYHGTPGGKVTVTGKNGKKKYRKEIRVSEGKVSTKNEALRYLWARHQIRRLSDMEKVARENDVAGQITELGLAYNLLTDYTSFVAVDTEKRTGGKPETTVRQPLPLPEGVSNNAVGALAMQRPIPATRGMVREQGLLPFKKRVVKRNVEIESLKSESEKATGTKAAKPGVKRQELMEKIRELEQRKQKLRNHVTKKTESMNAPRKSIPEIIARYEKLLANCAVRKSERCADVIYTLGTLYYDKACDDYIGKHEDYEKAMEVYEHNPEGVKPEKPVSDYSQSLEMYERLITEYPDFKKLSEAYYQIGSIYLLMGDSEKAREMLAVVVEKYPHSPRRSMGSHRLAELCYKDKDYSCEKKHLEEIKEEQVDVRTWELVHYRKAEAYFNTGDYKNALNLFFTYVEKCDAGLYPKQEFRDMAIKYIGIIFTNMNNGFEQAEAFFKKNGSKPYEPIVYFKMGGRYHSLKKYELAVTSFGYALEKFPMYGNAPDVTLKLIECYNNLSDTKKVTEERKRLVEEYGPESKWSETNSGDSVAIKKARAAIQKVKNTESR